MTSASWRSAMPDSERLVVIGELGRPYGLGGELHVTPLTDDPARFGSLRECVVWDTARGTRESRRLTARRGHGGGMVVALSGCDSPEMARTLTGRLLAIPEAEALPLDDAHFYPWQLEGCRVVTDGGREVGVVAGIERGPAQDLWVVRDGARDHLIPAVAEIVREVDLTARRVVISPPEGLLDL
jgi:16S rRNA processing protein RimM